MTDLPKKQDERGFLVEFLKSSELPESDKDFKQIYFATIAPSATRGNHYHLNKTEWITLVNGSAQVVLKNIKTDETTSIIVDSAKGESVQRILIKPNTAHAFKNRSDSVIVLIAYSNKIYDKNDSDTHEHMVL